MLELGHLLLDGFLFARHRLLVKFLVLAVFAFTAAAATSTASSAVRVLDARDGDLLPQATEGLDGRELAGVQLPQRGQLVHEAVLRGDVIAEGHVAQHRQPLRALGVVQLLHLRFLPRAQLGEGPRFRP